MDSTLNKYREALNQSENLKDELKEIRQAYPKYKPSGVKSVYDLLKRDLEYWNDLVECYNWLLQMEIPLDEFNRVYAQATSEVTDILNRYETDAFLNVFMADHKLSAYIRYYIKTKEITYTVAPIDSELPYTSMTDDYYETSIIKGELLLHELHSKWKEYGNIPDYECLGSRKFIYRNYMLKSAYEILLLMSGRLRRI